MKFLKFKNLYNFLYQFRAKKVQMANRFNLISFIVKYNKYSVQLIDKTKIQQFRLRANKIDKIH